MSNIASHFSQPLLKTPFHERARALSQVDSFIPWAGYTTVDVFTTVEQEYFAIRNATTLYDLTPMVKYRIAGPGAVRYLNRLVTRDIAKLKPDRVAYCVWCNDAGHLLDDGTVFRLGRRRVPAVHGRAAARLAARLGDRVRCRDREVDRGDRGARGARPDVLRGAEGFGPRRNRAPQAVRDRPLRARRGARSWCRARGSPATWATSCGCRPATPTASGMR